MKKILSFVLAAVALVFTACSNDETIETSGNGQNNKGMVLVATVSQQSSRASIDASETFGKWTFTFDDDDNDKVVVGNKTIDNYYTFTESGNTFSSADAKVTTSATDWYAYYPATTFDLTNQEGTVESAAKLYALAGKTAEATTGSTPLEISMDAKAAVLRIVKVDNYGPCDIYLKTDGKYVSGLTANKNKVGFDVKTSTDKVSVFKKNNTDKAGIYYVIVPAGVKIEVWNDTKLINTTKDAGLTAGKYYTLTSGPTTGTATATINGKTEEIGWVQMWIGGPRIAVKNVEGQMNWTEAAKTRSDYVWGGNWRTPTKEEMDFVDKNGANTHNKENVDVENTKQDNVSGYLYKGVQPGYTKNNLFLPATDKTGGAVYWSATLENDKGVLLNMYPGETSPYHYFWTGEKYHEYAVRPILSKETVLWGEQNIK